ncbi:MAG: CARDB domain-containing protein, partial [Candidatus Eiseniibacteriota bacterium]
HTLWIIARDNLALRDSTSRAWTADLTAPTVAFATGPLENGYSTAAPVFTFSGTDNLTIAGQLRYAYSLDAAAFTSPSSSASASLSGLVAGPHTLAVHSLDLAGNVSSDVTRHWIVDGTPPETQITSGPADAAVLGVNTATYGYTGTDNLTPTANLSYQTRLDGGAWSATTGATVTALTGLADGTHTFDVRAVDQGGNADPTPASRGFTTDVLGPVITISNGPANSSCQNSTSATFNWSATDAVTPQPQLLYSWQFDAGAPTPFSPGTGATLSALAEGQHTFIVQAEDASSHVTSISRTFHVDVTTPIENAPTTHVLDLSHLRVQCSATDLGGVTGYHVQVSTDPAFGSVAADVNIDASGGYTFTGIPGSSYYARSQASDCAGNTTAFSGPSNIAILGNLPNLIVSSVSAAPTLTGGQSTVVNYTVSNNGVGATSVPSWADYIYLSPTPAYNSQTGIYLNQRTNLTVLAPGDAYSSSMSVTVPIGTSGTWYMVLVTDLFDSQPESSSADNSGASSAIAVSPGAYANLHVISVVAPPTALSSDVVTVNWTVRNDGSGRTNSTEWYDTILLSSDPNFDFAVLSGNRIRPIDVPLMVVHHVGALDPSATYSASAQVQLPGSFGGKRYLIVDSDLNVTTVNQSVLEQGSVFENGDDINAMASDSMVVTQEQPSDLTVDAVTIGATGVSGGTIPVSFTIGNHGFNATPASTNWTDRVWFSTDNALDASDVLMGSYAHSGGLALGATYLTSANLALPQGFAGTYFVIVQTDAGAAVQEFSETNNTGLAPQTTAITLAPWANLVPAALGLSDTIPAGGSGTANWTVTDNGLADANGAWTDNIEIGTSPTWTGGLTSIGSQRANHSLTHGQSYSASATLNVPVSFAGTYYVFARTDVLNEVWEQTDEGDNAVLLGSVLVTPHAPIDLVVTNVTAPASGAGGQNIDVAWSVTNQGTGGTLTGFWNEDVWLSSDATWSSSDILIASSGHSGALTTGAHYTHPLTITLPQGLSGTYDVIVRSDPTGATGDGALANNVAVSAGTIVVTSPPPPQLTVSNLVVPANPVAGQPVLASFDVHNVGTGPVPNTTWFSAVYLSQDPWLDGSDVQLGSIAGSPGLGAGATENRSLSVTLPNYASGAYYVIAMTDSRNDVWEGGAESDNTTFTTTLITLPPPADLVVQNVLVPGAGVPGQAVTVNFTLYNQGTNPAVGTLQNAAYVSGDASFAASDDPLVGIQSTT